MLLSGLAVRTRATGVNHASYRGQIAGPEFLNGVANTGHSADDFMTRHARINRIVPLVAGLVNVGVTNATEQNIDLDVRRSGFAAGNRKRGKRRTTRSEPHRIWW